MGASAAGGTGSQSPLLLLPSYLWLLGLLESCVVSPAATKSSGAVDSTAMAGGPELQPLTLLFPQFCLLFVFQSTTFRCTDVWNSLVSWCVGQRHLC